MRSSDVRLAGLGVGGDPREHGADVDRHAHLDEDLGHAPAAGDGISMSILSVETSQIVSSASTQSPTRLCHSTTVPSATDTPIWGIVDIDERSQ